MKRYLFTVSQIFTGLIISIFLVSTAAANHPAIIRFINGNWFDGKGFQPKTAFSINGVIGFKYDGKLDGTVDLRNGYVIPPFAEAHTHQFLDVMNFKEQIDDYLNKGIFYAKNVNSLPKFTIRVRPFINNGTSVDVVYSGGGLTATGGHPVQIYDSLAKNNVFPGLTSADMNNQAYFIIDNERDLSEKWELIKSGKPDLIKTYLEHSEEYELRKNDPKYFGKRGLNPLLLPKIVEKAHRDNLRVSVHITTAWDFRRAVMAGVDEISHLPLERITERDARLAAQKKVFVVTTTLSHRDTSGIQDLDSIHRDNLKLLFKAGVKLALGTDNMPTGVVEEAENLARLKVFDHLALLKIWTENTPQTIFPTRKIGFLKTGYEANFIVLKGNPVEDFFNVRGITFRFKQGHEIKTSKD